MTRGRRPKPPFLRLVDGTHRPDRHGDAEATRNAAAKAAGKFGPLTKPKRLKPAAARAWDEWIAPAWWLDDSRGAAAIAFCELWQEFRFSPANFPASKHSQMRAYMADLGLTDQRNRPEKPAGGKDEFFGD